MRLTRLVSLWGILALAGALLAIYAGYVIVNAWYLVRDNPQLTPHQNFIARVEISLAAFAIGFIAVYFARWSFLKSGVLRATTQQEGK